MLTVPLAVRRYFRYFDWLSLVIILALAAIGLTFIFSATYTDDKPYSLFFKKQLFGVACGLMLYFIFSALDYRHICQWGYLLYISVICLLLFTLIKGKMGMGAQRWVDFMFFKFQPSELAKLFLPAFMTYYLHLRNDVPIYTPADFMPVFGIIMVSTLFILKQPDLGTAVLVFLSGLTLLWIANISKKFFIALLLMFTICAPLLWCFLKPYQKNRIMVFLGQGEVTKERYQLEQSTIAIGSGGFWGKGLLRGTQNRFLFLPEGRTDFIFAVLCEEWGFGGSLLVLILYTLLFLRLFYIIATIHHFFAQLLAAGLLMHIVLSTIINIGMVTGLLPIVGIPLPLMSYGVTNLWITFASLGWINGIGIRRFYIGE